MNSPEEAFNPPQPPNIPQLDGGMSCEQARRQIERMIHDHDLKDIERMLLYNHMRICVSCKAEYEGQRRLETRLKTAFAALDTTPNFNKRLMALLPPLPSKTEKSNAAWTSTDNLANDSWRDIQPDTYSGSGGRMLGGYRIGWAVTMVVFTGLLIAFVRFGFGLGAGHEGDAPPVVSKVDGVANVIHDGHSISMASETVLLNSDTIVAGNSNVSVTLSSAAIQVANLVLAPGSQLQIRNRHDYSVLKGKVYFDVNKNRPHEKGEDFVVRASSIASVHVTGTKFLVELSDPQLTSQIALAKAAAGIVVDEGQVEVRANNGPPLPLLRGQVLELTVNGTIIRNNTEDLGARLAWVKSNASAGHLPGPVAPVPTKPMPIPAAPTQPASANAADPKLNWEIGITDLPLAGRTLPEGISMLGNLLGQPRELQELYAASGDLAPVLGNRKLSFSVCREMPLRSVLCWMARDLGLRLESGTNAEQRMLRFRNAEEHEPIGAVERGNIPDDVMASLATPFEKDFHLQDLSVESIASLSAQAHVTIIVDHAFWNGGLANLKEMPSAQNSGVWLQQLLARTSSIMAWYDHALYIASPGDIEKLTQCQRVSRSIDSLLQHPNNSMIVETIFRDLKFPPMDGAGNLRIAIDSGLSETQAFTHVSVDINGPQGPVLRYTSGLVGEALAAKMLSLLEAESPAAAGPADFLSQPLPPCHVPDFQALIERAKSYAPVELRIKTPPFSKQAFVNKNLTLGQALEWSAWLSGCGVLRENNLVAVDTVRHCYGPPALQVVSLAMIADREPELTEELPQAFTHLLRKIYPAFFGPHTEIYSLGSRVIFTGDRRQLQLAQRLRSLLARSLDGVSKKPFVLADWRPEWRIQIEKNLADPFQTAGTNKLSGKFAGLLRLSELSSQLRCTVLVDPAAMRDHGDTQIEDLDVTGLSTGEVLDRLVHLAGLSATINGEVIWIRP